MSDKRGQLEGLDEARSELANADLEAMRTLQKCEIRLNHHKQALSELGFAKLELTG